MSTAMDPTTTGITVFKTPKVFILKTLLVRTINNAAARLAVNN